MRRMLIVALAGALAAAPAAAQPAAAAPPQAAESVTPAKLALAHRFLKAIDYERLMDRMMSTFLPVMVEQAARQHPELSAEQRQAITEVARQVMRHKLTPRLMERIAPLYASTFSESELTSIVEFYESPAGRAVTAKMPLLAPKAAELTRQLEPEIRTEMLIALCQRVRCDAPAARPS